MARSNDQKFNELRHIKKTKKPKSCSLCGRIIPAGHKAHNYVGILEGDFQNWYLCDFCFQNVLDKVGYGEYLDSDYFWQYFRDNYLVCPECGEFDEHKDNYRFLDAFSETVGCNCSHCGHKYAVNIPFDVPACEVEVTPDA